MFIFARKCTIFYVYYLYIYTKLTVLHKKYTVVKIFLHFYLFLINLFSTFATRESENIS